VATLGGLGRVRGSAGPFSWLQDQTFGTPNLRSAEGCERKAAMVVALAREATERHAGSLRVYSVFMERLNPREGGDVMGLFGTCGPC